MPKKERIYKCCYCKQPINENELVEFETGKKNIVKKRSHMTCRSKILARKAFFDLFLDVLDVPSLDKRTVLLIDSFHRKGYQWDVITHALLEKKKPIVDNFQKGTPYIVAILQNQLPFSYKIIEKQNSNNKRQEQLKTQINENELFQQDDIIEYKSQNNNKDISHLLD